MKTPIKSIESKPTGVVCLMALLVLVLLFSACAVRNDFRLGLGAMQEKNWDRAVEHLLKAVGDHPGHVEYRVSLANALLAASNHHLDRGREFAAAGHRNAALAEFEKALEYNPENNRARTQKHRLMKAIKEQEKQRQQDSRQRLLEQRDQVTGPVKPRIRYKDKPYRLKFVRANIQQIFNALGKAAGVQFIFDNGFKSKKMAVDLENVSFMEALDKIILQAGLFYKVIDDHTVLLIPDTPANRRDHEELVIKTVFLSNGDPEEIEKIIRTLTGIKVMAVSKELSSITFKGRPDEVRLAARLVGVYDKPRGELFVDIEIIEVNRARAREHGIELSAYQLTQSYSPDTGDGGEGGGSSIRLHRLLHTDASDYLLSLPSVHYKLLKTDRNSRIKARPQLRVLDRQKVDVRLGDKVPIPTTSFVPYNIQGPAQQPITSYQMQDIGINIEITPQIHHDGLVTLDMKFELTFITNPGTERLPPTLGNRMVNTVIKLRDNETSILAGLLRDTERKAMRGVPFLSRVPLLKDIFSGNKNELEQTDIILTLTPRIIRFPEIGEEDLEMIWSGTQARPGLKEPPVRLQPDAEKKQQEKQDKQDKQSK